MSGTVARLHESACGYAGPSPPRPPAPPPAPPLLPRPPQRPPPPTASAGVLRRASDEQPYDEDCAPVTYTQCVRAAEQMAATSPTVSAAVQLSQAACEGIDDEATSCFLGCALGNELGVPAVFTFLRDSVAAAGGGKYMTHRCADNADHPFCLCAEDAKPVTTAETLLEWLDYAYAGNPASGTQAAQPSGHYKPVAVDSVLPAEFAYSTHTFACRGSDSGAGACTRACAGDLMGRLRAFHVVGLSQPPSPPPPNPPPSPPKPPPAPKPPLSEFRFNGATDGCSKSGIYTGSECRDGGPGSVWPPACSYGSQALHALEPITHAYLPPSSHSLACTTFHTSPSMSSWEASLHFRNSYRTPPVPGVDFSL